MTRLGVGDGSNMKQRIGDALRNAAVRFGVALDLWTKDELESHIEAPDLKNEKPSDHAKRAETPAEPRSLAPECDDTGELLTTEQIAELMQIAKRKGYATKEAATAFLDHEAMLPFTKLRASEFSSFKKLVIEAGWRKPEAVDINDDDAASAIEGQL